MHLAVMSNKNFHKFCDCDNIFISSITADNPLGMHMAEMAVIHDYKHYIQCRRKSREEKVVGMYQIGTCGSADTLKLNSSETKRTLC